RVLYNRLSFDRRKQVIGIQKTDPFTAARSKPRVERRSLTTVFLEPGDNTRSITCNDLARVIRRAVVHYNYFRVRVALIQSAVNGVAQKSTIVIVVDDDADQWLHAHALAFDKRTCA